MTSTQTDLLIFDGDCGYCQRWIDRWRRYTKNAFTAKPYQSLSDAELLKIGVDKGACEKAVHFVDSNGRVTRAALAVFVAIRSRFLGRMLLNLYGDSRTFAYVAERMYAWVANNRYLLSKLKL